MKVLSRHSGNGKAKACETGGRRLLQPGLTAAELRGQRRGSRVLVIASHSACAGCPAVFALCWRPYLEDCRFAFVHSCARKTGMAVIFSISVRRIAAYRLDGGVDERAHRNGLQRVRINSDVKKRKGRHRHRAYRPRIGLVLPLSRTE